MCVCARTLSRSQFLVVFQSFKSNFGFAVGGQCRSLEAELPHSRGRTRGRPMAAERISVFKAFENKLLQFPGCRVGLAEGFLGRLLLESRLQGLPVRQREA